MSPPAQIRAVISPATTRGSCAQAVSRSCPVSALAELPSASPSAPASAALLHALASKLANERTTIERLDIGRNILPLLIGPSATTKPSATLRLRRRAQSRELRHRSVFES